MKKIIASTFVAAAMVLSIGAPSNAATADTAKNSIGAETSIVKPGKVKPPIVVTPTRIDWY